MDNQTLNYYKNNAEQLFSRYQSCEGGISQYFIESFKPDSRVLDIGTGSGRDLLILLNNGFDAYGFEPCYELREIFINNYPQYTNRIFEGQLPDLENPFDFQFAGILCSAVLMHIPDELLEKSIYSIYKLLELNGRLLISVPLHRPDIDKNNRDKDQRLFILKSPDKWKNLFKNKGFKLINEWKNSDGLNRPDHTWTTFLFEKY